MKSPTLEQRIRNDRRTPRMQRQQCRWCGDCGYLVVQTREDVATRQVRVGDAWETRTIRTEVDEYGPCPFCRRGFYEEHGDPDHQQSESAVRSPWGREGFWRGRELPELQPLGSTSSERAPMPDDVRAWLNSIGVRTLAEAA